MFGFLVINKPAGITSRHALNQVAKQFRRTKVGHAGTLDPLATGVLVACIGPATRLTQFVQQMPKKYTACFRLGLQSSTEDVEGELTPIINPPMRLVHIRRVWARLGGVEGYGARISLVLWGQKGAVQKAV